MFDQLPLSIPLSIIALLLLMIFFITSADSATLVLGMQSTRGSLSPPNSVKTALGLAQSAIALILLYVGGLTALQNTLIAIALPFSIVMILMMISLVKSLQKELQMVEGKKKSKKM